MREVGSTGFHFRETICHNSIEKCNEDRDSKCLQSIHHNLFIEQFLEQQNQDIQFLFHSFLSAKYSPVSNPDETFKEITFTNLWANVLREVAKS
jgi:hypothetical protein